MKPDTINKEEFIINVGPLNSLASLTYFLNNRINELNNEYKSGINPKIIWDLRNVMPRYQSMASLTAFLSLAHRLRVFSGQASNAFIRWNPEVLSFWDDIKLLNLSQRYNLIDWPEELIGGYQRDVTNPNTKIIAYPLDINTPSQKDSDNWKDWKDFKRQEIEKDINSRCEEVFRDSKNWEFQRDLRLQVASTSAELIVNSQLHGKSMAFFGIQRTSKRITVAVCDAGIGFINSLQKKNREWSNLRKLTDIEAIFIGSLENLREMGLRRAINKILDVGGYVLIYSGNAEIYWNDFIWENAKNNYNPNEYLIPSIEKILGSPLKGKADLDKKEKGYYRIWKYIILGTRISFEINLDEYKNKI